MTQEGKEQKAKIFISYAHEDIGMAKKIYHDLKNYNIDIWYDNVSLLGGQNWRVEIKKAIKESTYFLALMSSKSVNHVGYVQKELKIALDVLDLYPEHGIYVIPVRLDECKPSHDKLTELHWINIFPESEYRNGIKKILNVINPSYLILRSTPMFLSDEDATRMIRDYGFFDTIRNPDGLGYSHQYSLERISGEKVIIDKNACGLMWQQRGSSSRKTFLNSEQWIKDLNGKIFAGYKDWRLPTLEEAMSLMEPKKNKVDLYIDPLYNETQVEIFTCDTSFWGMSSVWTVNFDEGRCSNYNNFGNKYGYFRAVRSEQ